jgi:hypothetical protein
LGRQVGRVGVKSESGVEDHLVLLVDVGAGVVVRQVARTGTLQL